MSIAVFIVYSCTNGSEVLITETSSIVLSHNTLIKILCVSIIPIVVNMITAIVCFRVLQRKLHNLLVLSLCVSESFLGFSITWYCATKMSDFLQRSVAACLMQYFIVSYGLISTYSLLMIISLERYVVVQSLNFGISKTLDRFKYLIIFGTLAFGLLYSLEALLFTPHQESIVKCNLEQLYKDQLGFFVTFIAGYMTILMVIIICVSISTGYYIWRLFFRKNRIIHHEELSELESIVSEAENTIDGNIRPTQSSTKNIKFASKVQQTIQLLRSNRMKAEPIVPRVLFQQEKQKEQFKFDTWEVRAFTTSMTIALTTIVLTGPFVISYWIDLFCENCLGPIKFSLLVPLEINSLINPFIYAWRIPEIRQEFKKICRR